MDGVKEGNEESPQNGARLSSGRAMSLTDEWAWREVLDYDTTELQGKLPAWIASLFKGD
ncbi:MAG: hypothetical protein JXQ99_03675 [Hyphomicrobiaceae bacterium]